MANQTLQLCELLKREGVRVTVVRTNRPYRPRWVAQIRYLRAAFRLVPYLLQLWRAAGRVDLFHVMANSGWSWHLCAAPAVWIAQARGVRSVVNYRGGDADKFLVGSEAIVAKTLVRAAALVVPSAFLERIFATRGISSEVVPNVVDSERFHPDESSPNRNAANVLVARALERIYDIQTALRAFSLISKDLPGSTMWIAGSGPERGALMALATELGIARTVKFCGSVGRSEMAELYRMASVVINPSRIDNMPNSVLEAMASGAPVVSTNVGGVPFILQNRVTGLLVPPGDHVAMARAVKSVLGDADLRNRLRAAALREIEEYTWPKIRERWLKVYASAFEGRRSVIKLA